MSEVKPGAERARRAQEHGRVMRDLYKRCRLKNPPMCECGNTAARWEVRRELDGPVERFLCDACYDVAHPMTEQKESA